MKGTRKDADETGHLDLKEGEYGKAADGVWYARPPGYHVGCLRDHTITEHEDGTITASPSILIRLVGTDQQWHGYLERGIWREC